ncbi:MAG: hypothetical protein RQ714_05190 [Nitrosomonas sp.]|nr:hypothetical protein [Nitrosomonas sp.]
MKKSLRNKLTSCLCVTASMLLLSLPLSAQLMLAHEGHHGAGGCVIKSGDFPVTVSIYEVPKEGVPPMHSFCDHVPDIGKVSMTVEISDLDTREIPIAVRLVMDEHEGMDHGEHELLYMPAEQYLSGIIVVAAEFDQLGQYSVLLETDDGAGNTKTAVRIPVHVGGSGGHGSHGGGLGMLEIIFLVAAVGGAAFFFMRKKNADKDIAKESQG